jgi:hypothetical protein
MLHTRGCERPGLAGAWSALEFCHANEKTMDMLVLRRIAETDDSSPKSGPGPLAIRAEIG